LLPLSLLYPIPCPGRCGVKVLVNKVKHSNHKCVKHLLGSTGLPGMMHDRYNIMSWIQPSASYTTAQPCNMQVTEADNTTLNITKMASFKLRVAHRITMNIQAFVLPTLLNTSFHEPLTVKQADGAIRKRAKHFICTIRMVDDCGALSAMIDSKPRDPSLLDPQKIEKLLNEVKEIRLEDLPPHHSQDFGVKHIIEQNPGSTIPCAPIYRITPLELQEARRRITIFLEKGYIVPCESPFGTPMMFVQKKDGGLGLCLIIEGLNATLIKNRALLPLVEELIDSLQGKKIFSICDFKNFYYQVKIAPEDQHKAALRTPFGSYEFTVLPQGLCNSGPTFQTIMNINQENLIPLSNT
jgi:hypothetical protein